MAKATAIARAARNGRISASFHPVCSATPKRERRGRDDGPMTCRTSVNARPTRKGQARKRVTSQHRRLLIHVEVEIVGLADPVLAAAVPLISDPKEPSREDDCPFGGA